MRVAAAAACALGTVVGLVGISAPAHAVTTGTADYSCRVSWEPEPVDVTTEWNRNHGELEIAADLPTPVALGAGEVSTTVGSVVVPLLFLYAFQADPHGDAVILAPTAMNQQVNAPGTVNLTFSTPLLRAPCGLDGSSGFPV